MKRSNDRPNECLKRTATAPRAELDAERLERAARALVAGAGRGRVTLGAFRQRLPELARQLDADADSALPDYWGLSRNVDDDSGAAIVHPKLLTAIGALARRDARAGRDLAHAGLLHGYGYLLSWLRTRHGFKRERWLRPTIELGLGLPPRSLQARPDRGTLLQNLSYLVGRIALRDRPRRLARLERDALQVDAALRGYDVDALRVRRVVERVRVPRSAPAVGARRVELVTDLVDFARPSGGGERALLVYSIDDADAAGRYFVTCFPVDPATRDGLLQADRFGRRRAMRPRYQASVAGFPREPLYGSRARLE